MLNRTEIIACANLLEYPVIVSTNSHAHMYKYIYIYVQQFPSTIDDMTGVAVPLQQ